MSKQTGGDMFEFRHAPLLRSLAKHKHSWSLLIETPLGLYNPNYRVDLKESGGTQKDRLNMIDDELEVFNVQIARIVGITQTEFPSQVLSLKVELRADQEMNNLIARMISVETEEGLVDFFYPFTPNCLTFTEELKSRLWLHHLKHLRQRDPFVFLQAAKRINSFCQEVRDYKNHAANTKGQTKQQFQETLENNLLLLSRYWEWMGVELGLHVTRFPDQPYATIAMTGHGRIQRGIELKYDSNGYTRAKYKLRDKGKETVILCFEHNDNKLLKGEEYLDVIDAGELGRYMMSELNKIEINKEEE